MKEKLIFIYNADSGFRNMVMDSAHKIFSPSTYECKLCDITYGTFTENGVWKKFRKESDLQMEFLHKNEFEERYKSKFRHKFTFPIILVEVLDALEVLIKTGELNAMENASELIDLIKSRAN